VIPPRRLSWLRPVAGFLGLAALTGGVVALFATDNGAGSLFLLTLGMVLVLVALLGTRVELESFEILGAKMKVREVVKSRLDLAQRAGTAGRDGAGVEMREQAQALQTLVGLYDLYAYIRNTEPSSSRRTAALDELAQRMQDVGREVAFDPAEVSTWFHEGSDALRVVALNLMLARADCRDVLALLKTIEAPRSNFEQFYGLGLGLKMLDDLDELERRLLADAIRRAQRKRRFRRDGPLMRLGNHILAQLGDRTATGA
jgi:hypothetical protein